MDATNRYMDNLLFIWTKLFLSCYKTDNKIHKLTSYSLRKRSKSFQNPFLMLFTYIFNTILAGKLDSGEEISLGDLLEAVRKEDVLCIDILEKMGVNLGKGIAGLMNIFNPELVILGGTLSLAGEYISLPVKSAIRKYSLNLVNQDTEIKISKLGERAGAFGACLLSRSKLLGMIHY